MRAEKHGDNCSGAWVLRWQGLHRSALHTQQHQPTADAGFSHKIFSMHPGCGSQLSCYLEAINSLAFSDYQAIDPKYQAAGTCSGSSRRRAVRPPRTRFCRYLPSQGMPLLSAALPCPPGLRARIGNCAVLTDSQPARPARMTFCHQHIRMS